MRNQPLPSCLLAAILGAAIVIGLGLALSGYVSSSVNPIDPNVGIDVWRGAYTTALAWSAAVTAACSALWVLLAHGGRGLDTKTGAWYALWCFAIFASALLAWFIPPPVKEGPSMPMAACALLVLAGYWAATLFFTPDHYRYTPLLGRVLWGRRA